MAVRSMHPLHIVRCRQDGAGYCSLALAYLYAVASKDDKALFLLANRLLLPGRGWWAACLSFRCGEYQTSPGLLLKVLPVGSER